MKITTPRPEFDLCSPKPVNHLYLSPLITYLDQTNQDQHGHERYGPRRNVNGWLVQWPRVQE